MKDFDWIKDLISVEEKMEESGVIDLDATVDHSQLLESETTAFLHKLKDFFIDFSTVYNKMRTAAIGGVKVYGISKTPADFMVFRNGYKLFFCMKRPGTIGIKSHFQSSELLNPNQEALDQIGSEDYIEARLGAFGEVIWTYQEQLVNPEFLVKYYFTKFIKESTK